MNEEHVLARRELCGWWPPLGPRPSGGAQVGRGRVVVELQLESFRVLWMAVDGSLGVERRPPIKKYLRGMSSLGSGALGG